MRDQLTITAEKLYADAFLPTKAHDDDLGWDFYLPAGSVSLGCLVPGRGPRRLTLGVRLEFPAGHGMIFKDRSSLADRGIHLLGGVFDPPFRGEVEIILVNLGIDDFWLMPSMKICQGVLVPLVPAQVVEGKVSTDTRRAEKGFGSSGAVHQNKLPLPAEPVTKKGITK